MNTDPFEHWSPELETRLSSAIEQATGLPNSAYTRPEFFELERSRIFARTWMLAGFQHQLVRPGDMQPAEVAGCPILMVRRPDGGIGAFHNACRHRGAALLTAPCSGRNRIVCPYHSWVYDLDGQLQARPYFDSNEKKTSSLPDDPRLNLVPVRIATWLDFIFVNLSGDAPSLEEHLRPLQDGLADYDLSALQHAGTLEFDIQTNWKFAAENFMEQYHVPTAHRKLLRFAPMHTRTPGTWNQHCFSTFYQFPEPEAGRGAGLPHYPNLSETLRTRGIWFLLFPTLAIELWPDQFAVMRIIPEAPGRTREEIHVYLMGEAAHAEAYRDERESVLQMWHDLNQEDVGLLEILQQGRRSPSYDGGVFSPHWEAPVLEFSRKLVQALKSD